jgi:type VI protein secretion system component VasK
MNQFEMVAFIVFVIAIFGIIRGRQPRRFRRWQEEQGAASDAEKQRLREEVQELKERVAVLERIATDSGTSLAHEIEKLRDR